MPQCVFGVPQAPRTDTHTRPQHPSTSPIHVIPPGCFQASGQSHTVIRYAPVEAPWFCVLSLWLQAPTVLPVLSTNL